MATTKKTTYRNGKDILEELLNLETWDKDLKGNRAKMTIGELMHVRMVKKALEGDLKAYAEVLDRVEGKAVQKIEEKSEHTFVSKPLSELVSFVQNTKTLDEATCKVIDLQAEDYTVESVEPQSDDFEAPDSDTGFTFDIENQEDIQDVGD